MGGQRYVKISVEFIFDIFRTFKFKEHLPSLSIIAAVAVINAAVFLAVLAVDVWEITGITPVQGFWWHAFRNRGPVEWMQWFFISLTVLSSAALFGIFKERGDRKAQLFWGLVSLTFILMLIEDAGDPRHVLAHYGFSLFSIKKSHIEGLFYIMVIGPIMYGYLRFWKVPFSYPQVRPYLLVGPFLYALAGATSVFRNQGDFYVNLGDKLSAAYFSNKIPGFFLMDFVFEEMLELTAASIFFAGVLMYWRKALGKD